MLGIVGNSLIDFISSIFEILIFVFMISIFLDFTERAKKNVILYFVIYVVLKIAKIIFPIVFLVDFITSIYILIFVFIAFKGNFAHKIFAFCTAVCLNYVVDIFIISFTNMGFNYNLFFSTLSGGIRGIWVTIIKLILIILVYILLKNFATNTTLKINILSSVQTLILIMLPAFSFATITILDWGVRNFVNVPVNTSAFLLIASLCTIIYNVIVMILIDKMILNKKYKHLNEMSEAQLRTQFNHYEQIMSKNQETRKLKHDMKNHLRLIRSLIETNDIDEAKGLLDEIEDTMSGLDLEISSGNNITDAILNEKNKMAHSLGVKFEFSEILPSDNFINPFDISTIFSNALDNALEAAVKVSGSERFVRTATYIQGKCLFILIENSVEKDIKITGKEIESTKPNKEQHGFGLKNIKDSVEKYGGSLSTICENRIFKLEILLNIKI
ncbi:sensor histidine kinase [Ruminiclostridium cellulolyticum]|uniref:Signal transduction histidine kinase regulating citrate/malate metabolism n=1 Tax=Ruminiclostridium cellulolyticum (strain ATCC 35319 / DSM 5812 / JCM 6584 / H10) TaxID=394503 RepID=B8I4V2_RUMCH|nr:sensor histidine kinase [Ruminiclostridium cellulolyticum]ACL76606.1 signal transduction histidine kinase regulating citrate/malate metabolism [Ruminiclostridium cellulolyticum H10]